MNYLASLLFSFLLLPAWAQQPHFALRNLSLPKEIEFYDNQFSGLAISEGKLFLMSESRLQDKAEAKLYALQLANLDRKLADSTFVLPYQQLPITNLTALRAKIDAAGQSYEGLESILIDQGVVYLSVETATPSANCYLLKGNLRDAAVVLDTTFLVTMPKPLAADGSHIYNAGFEGLSKSNKDIVAFFEYNSFPAQNYVYQFDSQHLNSDAHPYRLPFEALPFRITDLTATSNTHFTAINYFFKGEGGDAIYRTPATDAANTKLITTQGTFKNYCRLISVERKGASYTWKPLWEFPELYSSYNWEGIAAYKNGYFIINDKYSPAKPYRTTLLYLQKAD